MAEPLKSSSMSMVIRPSSAPRDPVEFNPARVLGGAALRTSRKQGKPPATPTTTATASGSSTTAAPAAPWSLIEELEENRDIYTRVPKEGSTSLKLCLPYKERITELRVQCSHGHTGKPPGAEPATAALIIHGLPIVEAWPETQALLAVLQKVADLPKDIDGTIRSELDRLLDSISLPPYPVGTKYQHVYLEQKHGSHLTTTAGELRLDYHPFGVLCALESLSTQDINKDHREEIGVYLEKVRKSFRITVWLLNALVDKILNPRPGEWNGRHEA